jgi:ABC-type Fe3+ transport system permease subunit
MPGATRWRWSDEPFSYTKLCYAVPPLVFAIVLLLSAVGIDEWLPKSISFSVVTVGFIALASYFFFLIVVWRLLPARIRVRIPYDRKEAAEQKGDIRSFWTFYKVLLSRSSPR